MIHLQYVKPFLPRRKTRQRKTVPKDQRTTIYSSYPSMTILQSSFHHLSHYFVADQPTPNGTPARNSRPYDQGLLTIGFPWPLIIGPAIKPFLTWLTTTIPSTPGTFRHILSHKHHWRTGIQTSSQEKHLTSRQALFAGRFSNIHGSYGKYV